MSWKVALNGVVLDGDCDDNTAYGTLSYPPDGLGLPGLRTNDITFAQRDGVKHYSDWYEARTITLEDVTVCPDTCDSCASARARVRDIVKAWSRQCDDVELVVWPDCEAPETRTNLVPTPRPNPEWATVGPNPNDTWYYQLTEGSTVTYVPSTVPGAPTATRITSTGGTSAALLNGETPIVLPVPGGPVSASLWVRSSTQVILQVVADGSTAVIATPATVFGSWTRLTGTVPSASTITAVTLVTTAGWVEITGVMVEQTNVVGPYFDGATPSAGDIVYGFDGIPFASTSTEGPDRTIYGPFGIIGRPRQASVVWERGTSGCATMLLRFDGVDHRMYVLDPDGTPGSGVRCVTLTPEVSSVCRTYPRCYDPTWCYDTDSGNPGAGPIDIDVRSTICVSPTITLYGPLTDPIIENVTTGQSFGYAGTIAEIDPPVIIDTENGTATQGGASRTHLLTGDPTLVLTEGINTLRLSSYGSTDTGHAEVCFRDQVVVA